MGRASLLFRFKPATEMESSLRKWLLQDILPQLPSRPGIGSAHLFEGALTPPMTNEQRIRGADAGVDWAVLVTGYNQDALAKLMSPSCRSQAPLPSTWDSGSGKACFYVTVEQDRHVSATWRYPHKIVRKTLPAASVLPAAVIDSRDSEGGPYFYARVNTTDGAAIDIKEGHSQVACQQACERFNSALYPR